MKTQINPDKIRHRLIQIIVLSVIYFLLPTFSLAQTVSSRELIENAKHYDKKEIAYEGEAIGDIMRRKNFCWINVNDGKTTIGVWLPKEEASKIEYTGSYRFKGDWLRTRGIFNRSCPEHGGDLDIHAISLERIESGREIKERLSSDKLNLSIKLGGLLLCLIILSLFFRPQRKR